MKLINLINYLIWPLHKKKIVFILQKRTLRIIYGVPPRTSCKPLFIQSGILTLPSMFVLASLLYVKNNIENFTVCTNLHNYPTQNNLNLCIDRCKYSTTQSSFVIISLKLFNSLPLILENFLLKLLRGGLGTHWRLYLFIVLMNFIMYTGNCPHDDVIHNLYVNDTKSSIYLSIYLSTK